MSLDQRLAAAARRVGDGVVPPEVDLDMVRTRARRNQRRTRTLIASTTVAAAVLAGFFTFGGRPSAAPDPVTPTPSPSPTPTATVQTQPWGPGIVTPAEAVLDPEARLGMVGISAAEPGVRLAIWSLDGYLGMATTQDDFASTVYAAPPGGAADPRISSPRDDLFLLEAEGRPWLVGGDGTSRRVSFVQRDALPADPRQWFQCEGSWRQTWCALDPDTATAFKWSLTWDGSAVPPGPAVVPWGANPEPRAVGSTGVLEAWWGSGNARKVRTLATADSGDYVLGCPPGLMALWSSRSGSGTVQIHTSRDQGATWRTTSHRLAEIDNMWGLRCTPGGGFLALSDKAVHRLEDDQGAFVEVFSTGGSLVQRDGGFSVQVVGDSLVLLGRGVGAISADDGRSWTTVEDWR